MPYPGRGHINPMMNVCRLLASRGILVTFVVTQEWLGLLSSDPKPPNLHLRSIPNVLPSETIRGANYKEFFEAVYTKMEAPFEQVLDGLQRPITGILADFFLYWVVAVGCRRQIKVFSLCAQAVSWFAIHYHFDLLVTNVHLPADKAERGDERVECIPGISTRVSDLPTSCFSTYSTPIVLEAVSWVTKAQCLLFTSFYELEPDLVDILKQKLPIPIYPVGPSIPYMMAQEQPMKSIYHNQEANCYMAWLDSQPRSSVLYISLGSFLPVSGQQMDEIRMGIQASGVRYLWVIRENSSKVSIKSDDMGLVIPWCEQLKVMCHPSVGGFLTHSGWNSTLEGVYAGVPMLAFPLSLDQFHNSKLIAEDWKIGLRIKKQAGEERVVKREVITKFVQMLMDPDGNKSREMRVKAKNLQLKCHAALGDGGSSFASLNALIKDLMGYGT
ncbi:UDP-glycosyltransferase 87A1-like [Cocos nucifera]|uniref:Glycosyltransferase n=1 Tax=Cocos nucifera TaxID=13894 RepID=A0A8K0HW89_COCNU|nr:UDP-glycosyltransferase 87A1-like [Cocos nucifera]